MQFDAAQIVTMNWKSKVIYSPFHQQVQLALLVLDNPRKDNKTIDSLIFLAIFDVNSPFSLGSEDHMGNEACTNI